MGDLQTVNDLQALTPKQLKRKLGRPTKYNSGVLVKAIEYLSTYKDNDEELPTREGLAQALDIDRKTITEWDEDESKPEFSRIVSALDNKQALELITGGVRGKIPPKIVALLLARHGYTEKGEENQGVSITVNVDRTCGGVVIDGETLDESTS